MYTTIPKPEIIDQRPPSGEPLPQVIDHRNLKEKSRWTERTRKEQLPYYTLKQQRDYLLEAEFKYKKTIRELEKEREELVVTYENTYQENKQLKSILEHGPDATKLKQLTKDKREQKGIIEKLEEDNKLLALRLKELEKLANPAHNDVIEKSWKDTLDKVRRKREEEDSIPTQGPFAGGKLFKKKRIAIDDARMEELDTYDLQLDTIQKETQVLLNKVKQLKKEKEQIDYTLMMGKGAVTKNAVVANAISEKLNRDLNKYAIRLEKLKIKHKGAKQYITEIRELVGNNVGDESKTPGQSLNISKATIGDDPSSPDAASINSKRLRTYKANGQIKTPDAQTNQHTNVPHLPEISPPTENHSGPVSPRSKTSKHRSENPNQGSPSPAKPRFSKLPVNTNWIPPKHFDRPDSYTEIHHQKAVHHSTDNSYQAENTLPNGQVLNDKFRDDMRIQKEKHRIQTSSQGANVKMTRAQSMRNSWVKHKGELINNGNGEQQMKNNDNFSPRSNNRLAVQKSARTSNSYPRSPPIKRHSKHLLDDSSSYDDVLAYLKRQSEGQDMGIQFNDAYKEHRERQHSESPVPIGFNTDGRNIHGRDAVYLMGNTGIRRENFYRYL